MSEEKTSKQTKQTKQTKQINNPMDDTSFQGGAEYNVYGSF